MNANRFTHPAAYLLCTLTLLLSSKRSDICGGDKSQRACCQFVGNVSHSSSLKNSCRKKISGLCYVVALTFAQRSSEDTPQNLV